MCVVTQDDPIKVLCRTKSIYYDFSRNIARFKRDSCEIMAKQTQIYTCDVSYFIVHYKS